MRVCDLKMGDYPFEAERFQWKCQGACHSNDFSVVIISDEAFYAIDSVRYMMNIELYHASKFGNGKKVAEELKTIMESKGHKVNVHHISESNPKSIPSADLYIFGSPTRIGKPIGSMRRFLKKINLPPGTRYAVFATHGEAVPNKKTGRIPTDEEMARWRRTIPEMDSILMGKNLVKIADMKFFVSGKDLKGSLIEGWEEKVVEFASQLSLDL